MTKYAAIFTPSPEIDAWTQACVKGTPPGRTYISWSAATQPSDGINEVLLHFCAETHTGHQLLQQLAILHLQTLPSVTHHTVF